MTIQIFNSKKKVFAKKQFNRKTILNYPSDSQVKRKSK
jgi:hypothetical protein